MREIRVETYLYNGITAPDLDGLCIKIPPAGRNNQPDRLILLPFVVPHEIETKKPGKDATEAQRREHGRHAMRNMPVYVLDTIAKVESHLCKLRVMRLHWKPYDGPYDAEQLRLRCPDNLSRLVRRS